MCFWGAGFPKYVNAALPRGRGWRMIYGCVFFAHVVVALYRSRRQLRTFRRAKEPRGDNTPQQLCLLSNADLAGFLKTKNTCRKPSTADCFASAQSALCDFIFLRAHASGQATIQSMYDRGQRMNVCVTAIILLFISSMRGPPYTTAVKTPSREGVLSGRMHAFAHRNHFPKNDQH